MSKRIGVPPPANDRPQDKAPFLRWPVARREIYLSLALALLAPLLWGVVIFGFRALLVIAATVAGAAGTYRLLKRFTRRGKELLFVHTLASALLLAALCEPLWPPAPMFVAGAVLVGLLWLWGGPGRERVQSSLLVAVLATLALATPLNPVPPTAPAVLARDRLFVGDLAYSEPAASAAWTSSGQIGGHDAQAMMPPQELSGEVLARMASAGHQGAIDPGLRAGLRDEFAAAVTTGLPPLGQILLGVRPGRIGTGWILGIVLAGLYLAYRNIVRPRSALLLLASIIAGLLIGTFSVGGVSLLGGMAQRGPHGLLSIDELVTLLSYEILSSDILFAVVFVLAMPGSEPITPRGRRWYLILVGLIAGYAHHWLMPLPGAVVVLLVAQPLTRLFDRFLAPRSWLSCATSNAKNQGIGSSDHPAPQDGLS